MAVVSVRIEVRTAASSVWVGAMHRLRWIIGRRRALRWAIAGARRLARWRLHGAGRALGRWQPLPASAWAAIEAHAWDAEG